MIAGFELSRHLRDVKGLFSPFTYSIGLRQPLDAALNFPAYPLPAEPTPGELDQFAATLTFFHEGAHLAQYLSTSFGLRCLRHSIICLRYLAEGDGWQLPIMATAFAALKEEREFEARALGRFVNFLDSADQLRLCVQDIPSTVRHSGSLVQILWEPWTPYLHLPYDADEYPDDLANRSRRVEDFARSGVPELRQPHLWFSTDDGTKSILLNGAALMEGFALLVELNNIFNALGVDVASRIDLDTLLSIGTEYVSPLVFGLGVGACVRANMIPHMAVCIDVALMYDPFVLYNAPNLEPPSPGEPRDRYPGDTFVAACEAAAHVAPIREYSDDEVGRFYSDLCREMELPSPQWMAEQAYERAKALLSQLDNPEEVWLGKAVAMHKHGLEVRLQNPGAYPMRLVTTNGILDVYEPVKRFVSLFDVDGRQPNVFDPRNMDLLSLHSLMVSALKGPRIDCPLKNGSPFECPHSMSGQNSLCVFEVDGQRAECLVDILERGFHLTAES